MDAAHRGEVALTANNYAEAISQYTTAIAQSPSAATYYLKRSIAYQRTGDFSSAFSDAEIAVVGAHQRAKRELIAQAQLRRGIALYNLGRYADAEFLFKVAKRFDGKDKSFGSWEEKVRLKMKDLEDADPGKVVSVKEMPDVKMPEAGVAGSAGKAKNSQESKTTSATTATPSAANGSSNGAANGSTTQATLQPQQGVQTPADKIKHDWYQNNENVYLTLLVKGVPKDLATVEIEAGSVSISFPMPSGSQYDFSLDPFFAAVNPSACSFKILGTKIEVVLKKAQPGQKWSALEGTTPIATSSAAQQIHSSIPVAQATAPAYPTSSRAGPKNWDKIVDSFAKPSKPLPKSSASKLEGKHKARTSKTTESEESASDSEPENSAKTTKDKEKDKDYIDFDDEDGDDVNKFFKQLYKNATPDTKRAMMKSYQESGGTALSTNWEEVKQAPVPISPPDGMEAKKWEQ